MHRWLSEVVVKRCIGEFMIKKRKIRRFFKVFLATILMLSWMLASWPRLPFINFPPEIKKIQAVAPTFVAAGTTVGGTAARSCALPAGIATDDILLLFIETANQVVTVANQAGGTWTEVTDSPQSTGGTSLTVFWSRYNGTQTAPTTSDSGDHQLCVIIGVNGVVTTGDPWDVTAGGVDATSDTSGAIPGDTTTVVDTLVVMAVGGDLPDANSTTEFSGWTNADLSSVTEQVDYANKSGNGGSIGVATGGKASAGAYTTTDVTHATSAVKGMISIALKPPVVVPYLTQNDFEIFVDNDALTPTDAWPSGARNLDENTALTPLPVANDPVDPSDEVRIRMNIAVTVTQLAALAEGFILQYAKADDCTAGPSWTDVGSGDWGFATSSVSNNTTLTSTVIDTSTVLGRYNNADPSTTNPNAVPAGQAVEWDWHVVYNGSAGAGTYCFRMRKDDPADLNAYEDDGYPKISTRPIISDQMRHGGFFSSSAEQGFWWTE